MYYWLKKANTYWPNMFIQGDSLRYTPVQYGWSLLSLSFVNPWPTQWVWASNQLCGESPVGLISFKIETEQHVQVMIEMPNVSSFISLFNSILISLLKSVVVKNIKRYNWCDLSIIFVSILEPKKVTNT